MRRPALAGLAAVLVCVATSAAAQDFRTVTWGMSPAEVGAAEKDLKLSEMKGTSRSLLKAPVNVMDHAGVLTYVFEADKLVSAQYTFDDEADMRTYNEIAGVLAGKYGAPLDVGESHALWVTDRTIIRLSFGSSLCRVDYADKAWVADMREKQKAEYDQLF